MSGDFDAPIAKLTPPGLCVKVAGPASATVSPSHITGCSAMVVSSAHSH